MKKIIRGINVSRVYTNGQIDKAGDVLRKENIDSQKAQEAITVISDWRAAHSVYNEKLFSLLTKRSKAVDSKAVLVNRLKKIESIKLKLEVYTDTQLSRMQDIGGCRAIVRNLKKAKSLRNKMLSFTNKFNVVHQKDYIINPKETGYRGYHIVYEYKVKQDEYRILLELQIRTILQHAWATMVETVGLFTNQALKSNIGSDEWKNFFVLTSKLFEADEMGEKKNKKDIVSELKIVNKKNHFLEQINGFNITLDAVKESDASYYLLIFDYLEKRLSIIPYGKEELDKATSAYQIAEKGKENGEKNAVLVSANSFEDMKTGYQNYFANTSIFLDEYKRIVREN